MSANETIIFVIFWSISIILFYKWFQFYKRTKKMIKSICKCTDTTLRTTYQKNIRVYHYIYVFQGDEYTAGDAPRFRLPFFKPKINDELEIYINKRNPHNVLTPYYCFYSKLCLLLSISCIIFPFLITI